MTPDEECQHLWQATAPVPLPQEGGVAIIVVLACQRCAALVTKIAPPPEAPAAQGRIARAQLVPAGLPAAPAPLQRR